MTFLVTDRLASVSWDVNRDILTHFARKVSKSFTTQFLPEILPISLKTISNESITNSFTGNGYYSLFMFSCYKGNLE